MAEHGVDLVDLRRALAQHLEIDARGLGDFGEVFVGIGQKFMERRIEQANGHGQPGHDAEHVDEIVTLHGQQLLQRRAAGGFVVGEDHLAHGGDAPGLEKHMLGTAQADALGAEIPRCLGVLRGVGVGAHAHASGVVGPAHEGLKIVGQFRLDHRRLALHHRAGAAVYGDDIAGQYCYARGGETPALEVDVESARAGNTGPSHAARHHRRMAGHAAAAGQDAARRVHAVDVLGAGFDAHQNHRFAMRGRLGGGVGGKHHPARRRPGRGRQAAGDDGLRGRAIEHGMKKLIEGRRINPAHRFALIDDAFADHLDGDAYSGLGGAFAGAGLQHP